MQPYAGAVTRAVAFALDLLLLQGIILVMGGVAALIVAAFSDVSLDSLNLNGLEVALAAAGWWLAFTAYFCFFWSLTGQTPGMRLLGVRVTTVDGPLLRPRRGLVRVAGMIAAAIPLFAGYFMILVNNRRMGLHDVIAHTVVRYVEDEQPASSVRRAPSA